MTYFSDRIAETGDTYVLHTRTIQEDLCRACRRNTALDGVQQKLTTWRASFTLSQWNIAESNTNTCLLLGNQATTQERCRCRARRSSAADGVQLRPTTCATSCGAACQSPRSPPGCAEPPARSNGKFANSSAPCPSESVWSLCEHTAHLPGPAQGELPIPLRLIA